MRRVWIWPAGLGLIALTGLGILAWPSWAPSGVPPVAAARDAAPGFWQWGHAGAAPLSPPAAPTLADQAHRRLFVEGSLAGTEPAGDWCVSTGRLQPCAALRDRFDHYLLGLGEVEPSALRALVRRDAARAHGETLAEEIMAVWDRYEALRRQTPTVPFDARDRSTWGALLAEQRSVRRRLLGDDWARAFYADEEGDFEALQARLDAGQPLPPDPGAPVADAPADRAARYGAAAADRLGALDAAWADWERRLAGARQTWAQLREAPELSDPARAEALARYLAEHFRDDERQRVRVLLHL